MEKPELNKLFKDGNIQINLRRATFDRLQIKPSVNYRGKTQDEVFFQKQDGNNVEFEVVRRMDFDPEGVFEITVVYTIRRQIADEFVDGIPMVSPPVYCGVAAKSADAK